MSDRESFWNRAWLDGAREFYDDGEPDEDDYACRECGAPTDDGEGWDGLCGNCSDRKAMAEEAKRKQREVDNHDRRYDDVYSAQQGDIGDEPFDF